MNPLLTFLVTAAVAGPFSVNGADMTANLVKSGKATIAPSGIALAGGKVTLNASAQKALAGQISGKPFVVVVTLKEGTAPSAATALSLGPIKLTRKADGWYATAGTGSVSLGTASGGVLKTAIQADGTLLRAFKNGQVSGVAPYSGGGSGFELGPWQGTIQNLQIIPRSMMPQEAAALSQGAKSTSRSATMDVELVQFTKVPEPKDVLPYKHALVTHEYRVIAIKSGGIEGVKVGSLIRVARWGIIGGVKTPVAKIAKGARLTLKLDMFEDHKEVEREFTVDKLPTNIDAPYLLDTEKPGM